MNWKGKKVLVTGAEGFIGWNPKYSLKEGLSETIQFISENLNFYKPGFYTL